MCDVMDLFVALMPSNCELQCQVFFKIGLPPWCTLDSWRPSYIHSHDVDLMHFEWILNAHYCLLHKTATKKNLSILVSIKLYLFEYLE
jgi:hypothetical protein